MHLACLLFVTIAAGQQLSISATPSGSTLSGVVSLKSNSGTLLDTASATVYLTSDKPVTILSGTNPVTATSGEASFSLTVLGGATQVFLTAYAVGYSSITSNSLTVTVDTSTSGSANISQAIDVGTFYAEQNLTLTSSIAQSGTFFSGTCSVVDISSSYQEPSNSADLTSSSSSFIFTYFQAGSKTTFISICSGETCLSTFQTFTLVYRTRPLVVSFPDNIPNDTITPFTVQVRTYWENNMTNLFNLRSFTVDLSLSPPAAMSGMRTASTSGGVFIFADLKITDEGIYQVKASGSGIWSNVSESFTIVNTDGVASVLVNSSKNTAKLSEQFSVDVYLFNYYNKSYNASTTVYLYSLNGVYSGNTNQSYLVNSNVTSFTVSVNTLGPITFQAYTSNDTKNSVSSSFTVYVVDPLCQVFNPDYTCKTCVAYASQVNGLCKCTNNSNLINGQCYCLDGFTQKHNLCLECGNYFSASQITGYVSQDLFSVIVNFASQVNQTQSINCLQATSFPDPLNNYSFTCLWLNSQSFTLNSDQALPNQGFSLSLLNLFKPSTKTCIIIEDLFVFIQPPSPISLPFFQIICPEKVDIGCPGQDLLVSAVPTSGDYLYFWEVSQNTSSLELSFNSPYIKVPRSVLRPEPLVITLTVDSALALSPFQISKTILITNKKALEVSFNYPLYTTAPVSQDFYLTASVFDKCSSNSSNYTYTWINTQNTLINWNAVLEKNKNSSALIIPASLLAANKLYVISVLVSNDLYQGTSEIQVQTIPSDLLISINKWNGDIGATGIATLKATASDPDDPKAVLYYMWGCFYGGVACSNIANSTSDTFKFNCSLLPPNNYVSFQVTVSGVSKSASKTIELYVNSLLNADLSVPSIPSTIPSSSPVLILPSIKTNAAFTFKWFFTPRLPNPWAYDSSNLYISIPNNLMVPGTTYKLTMQMTNNQSSFYTHSVIQVPDSPHCGMLKVTNNLPYWNLDLYDCLSYNGALLYSFGIIKGKDFDKQTVQLPSPHGRIVVLPNITKVFAEICDIATCTTVSQFVDVSDFRRLDSLESAEGFIKNPEDVIQAIYLYGDALNSTQFVFLYNKFLDYFQNVVFTQNLFVLYTQKMKLVLRRTDSITKEVYQALINLFCTVYEKYKFPLSQAEMTLLLNSIDPYISLNSSETDIDLLNKLAYYYLNNSFPSASPVVHDGKYFMYIQRVTGSTLSSMLLRFKDWSIVLPQNKTVNPNTIYDLVITKLNSTTELVSLKIYNVGYFSGYNLVFTTRYEDGLNITSPGTVSLYYGLNNTYHYQCQLLNQNNSWDPLGCNTTSMSSTLTSADFFFIELLNFAIVGKKCPLNFYPLIALTAGVLLTLILYIRFHTHDQMTRGFKRPKTYLTMHPLLSMMMEQVKYVRVNLLLQIFTNSVMLFAMIGWMHLYFALPLHATYDSYEEFLNYHAEIGAIAFGICQVVFLPFFSVIIFVPINRRVFMILNLARLVIIIASVTGIFVMTFFYCGQFTFRWIINFVIYFPAQVVFLEAIYAFLFEMCIKEDQSRFKRVTTIQFNLGGSDSDEYDSLNGRVAPENGFLFKVYKDQNKKGPSAGGTLD